MTVTATEESRQYSGTLTLGTSTRQVTVTTTDTDTTVTAAPGSFSASDVGASITGAGIPAGATIVTVTDTDEVELSAAATATGTPEASITTPNAFAKQVFTCELEPSIDAQGDELTMLNGNVLGADESVRWVLKVGAVQDFMDPQGFLEYCRLNALQDVPFEWEPNSEVDSPTFSGTLKLRPGRYGGATKLRLTSEVEFPVLGEPSVSHPA